MSRLTDQFDMTFTVLTAVKVHLKLNQCVGSYPTYTDISLGLAKVLVRFEILY